MTAFPSPQAAEQVRAHKRPIYGSGAGFVQHWSGLKLNRAQALATLTRHLADSKSLTATDSEKRHAARCIAALNDAIAASFDEQET